MDAPCLWSSTYKAQDLATPAAWRQAARLRDERLTSLTESEQISTCVKQVDPEFQCRPLLASRRPLETTLGQ